MLLDAGIATIWQGRNKSSAGSMPDIMYDEQVFASYYGEKTVGIGRFWKAKAQDDCVDLLIQVQRSAKISTNYRCYLQPSGDSGATGWYKILQVQHVVDEDGQPMTDLTLQRIEGIDDEFSNNQESFASCI